MEIFKILSMKKVGLRWLLLSALLMLGCVSAPVYDGADEPNFDGSHFVNQTPMELGLSDLLRFGWQSLTQSTRWPDWVDVDQQSVPQERVRQGISVTYINHSTTLIQVCLLYTSPSPRDRSLSRMPSSA